MSFECLICFYTARGARIECCDPLCSAAVCIECGQALLEFCYREKDIPRCPQTGCRGEYLYSQITKLGKSSLHEYAELCVLNFKKTNSDSIGKAADYARMLERVREQRKAFIHREFPIAIALTIEYGLSSKLNRITRDNIEKVNSLLKTTNRKCSDLICTGNLDENMVCSMCEGRFCRECEKRIGENHECKQEDRESVLFVQGLVKCPKCLFPVIKSYGCDNMTCAVCSTNFDYNTGKVCVPGNHDPVVVKPIESSKLSQRYVGSYSGEIIFLLKLIESCEPKDYTDKTLCGMMKRMTIEKGGNTDDDHSVSKEYEKYKKTQIAHKNYYKIMTQINDRHIAKSLDGPFLKGILGFLKDHK